MITKENQGKVFCKGQGLNCPSCKDRYECVDVDIKMDRFVEPIIGNYYGGVEVYIVGNKYYLTLGNYDGLYGVEISESFAKAMEEEFKTEKEVVFFD